MNKQKKAAFGAVLVSAMLLPFGMAAPVEAAETVWMLSGAAAGSDGAPQVVSAGRTETPKIAAETASSVPPALAIPGEAGPDLDENNGSSAAGSQEKGTKAAKPIPAEAGKAEMVAGSNAKAAASDTSISKEHPLIVKADDMQYNSRTGDVDISGRVDMRHLTDIYETEHVYGNSKTQKYTIPVPVRWTAPDNVMDASNGTYDAKSGISEFSNIKGWNQGKYYYEGKSGTFDRNANKGVVQKGYFTTKHAVAKVPDYRIEADSIDIYPNDHYTAHNVSLFFKHIRLITLASYQGSLKNDGPSMWTLLPMPSYSSHNGFGVKNSYKLPLGNVENNLYFYARLGWFSKVGFKPDIGFQWDTKPGTLRFRYVKEESSLNDDHVWVEKRPSLSFDSRHFYIPHTNFYVGTRGEIGNWKEGRVSGNHKMWDVYLSHTPITMGPYLSFNWRTGYMKDYYGYNDSIRRNAYYSLGLSGHYGIFSSWINYTDNNLDGRTPYSFDTYDMNKPVTTGFRVQLTRLDAFSINYSIDTANGRLEHRDYTYYRDMHSFYGWITYRDIDKETQIMIQPKDFSF